MFPALMTSLVFSNGKENKIMKKISFIVLAAMAAVVLSCEKKEVIEEANVAPRYLKCVIVSPDSDSKIAVSNTGKSTWEVGDRILLHGEGSSNRKIVTLAAEDISADGKTATIDVSGVTPYDRSGSSPWYASQLFASYPGDLVPSGNLYYNSVFQGNLNEHLLVSGCDDTENPGVIYFYNHSGIMTFSVSGDYDGYILDGNLGERVGYSLLNSRIAHVLSAHGTKDLRYENSGNGFTSVPLTSISGSLVADGTTVNSIYFPTGVSLSGGFTMYLTKAGEKVKYVTTSKSVNIGVGQIMPLGLIPAEKIHTYVAPTSHNATHPSIAGATDLGASATANCYIVDASDASNAGEVFKFKAYKGNSTNNVGAIASVSVLWETYNNATDVEANSVILEADFDKQDANDYYEICFKMPETLHAGNAVIAAKDDSDNILWSWHIWVPETAVSAADYGIHTSGKNVMDRNLGALKVAVANPSAKIDVTSVGLVYQWGRKDPFPGPRSIETEGEYVSFARVAGTSPSAEKRQLSLLESIQSPTVFARGLYDGSTLTNNNWLNETDNTLWGDESSKTIYDPCPAGYRVPNRDKSASLWSGSSITTATGWSFNASQYWFTLGSPVTVFPAAGYNDGGSYKVTFRTVLWNAHADGDENAYNIYVYSGPKGANYSHGKNRGYYVRCVAE